MKRLATYELPSKAAFSIMCLLALVALFMVSLFTVIVPPLAVAMLGGIIFVAICFQYPLAAFCMALFGQVFDQLLVLVPYNGGDASFVNSLTVPKLMLAALMTVLLFRILLTKDKSPVRGLQRQALFVLLSLAFIASNLPGIVYRGIDSAVILVMSSLINCIMLAFLTIILVKDIRDVVIVLAVLLPAFVITGLMGSYEALTQTYILDLFGRPIPEDFASNADAGHFRVLGPSGDAVYYAVSLIVAIVSALVVLQHTRNRLLQAGIFASLLIFAFGVFSTASRGGFLSAVILAGVFFVMAKIRGKLFMALGGIGLFVLVFGLYTVCISELPLARLLGMGGAEEATNDRLGFYMKCIHMTEDSPLLGIGPGQFKKAHVNLYFDNRTPQEPYLPHNVYLQILAETGIFSLLIYLAIIAACFFPVLTALPRTKTVAQRNTAAALLGGVLALAAFATNTNLRESELVWLVFALAIIAGRTCPQRNIITEEALP